MGDGLKGMKRFLRRLTGRCGRRAVLSVSETGSRRANNQDRVYVNVLAGVYAVADGMGGGSCGEIASQIVCQRLEGVDWRSLGFEARVAAASRALGEANDAIREYVRAHGLSSMGSTAAVLLLDAVKRRRGAVIHAGDSRVYRVRGGRAEPLTVDHTIGRELGFYLREGRGQGGQKSRLNHVLTRAVGIAPRLEPVTAPVEFEDGDRFIVCSDGVHDVLSEERLGELAGSGSLAEARDRLRSEVEKGGSPDNYSFVLVGRGLLA